jgi:hypothetical protein
LFSIEVRKLLSYRVLQEHTLSGVGKNFLFAATVREAAAGPSALYEEGNADV